MRTFLLSAKKNKIKIKMKKESNIKFCMMNADLKIEPAPNTAQEQYFEPLL